MFRATNGIHYSSSPELDDCFIRENWSHQETFPDPMFTFWFSQGNCTTANQPSPTPCSFYDVPRNRHSALELSMNSSDSLNNDRRIPTMQKSEQFQQFGTSPPRSNMPQEFQQIPGPQMSSPIMARREMSNPPQMAQHQPMPYQPQMLVDPNTGQHYIFPTHQPQYFYPVIPTPVYYQPTAGGYIVASQPQPMPQPPQSPTHTRTTFFKPQPPQFNGYYVEHPPSSNVSVCGAPEADYFSRSHASRQSLESGSSGRTESERTRKNSRDSMSPAPQSTTQTSFARLPNNNETTQPGKFSTTSSCTSGFVSGTGDSAVDGNGINTSFTTNKTRPAWWGQQEASTRIGMDEKSSPTHRPVPEKRNSPVDEKEVEKTPTQPEIVGRTSPKPVQKAIRMDIDLSAPINHDSLEKKPQPSRPSVATAFTVTFDPEPNKPFSLQEAAKQAPRRFTRRSAPVKPTAPDSEGEQDPKHYLFNKMIQGLNKNSSRDLEPISDKEFDTLSEAGTYVVDSRSRMEESQVLASDEDSSSDETASTVSKSTSAKVAANSTVQTSTKSLLAQRLEELRKRTSPPISLLKQPSTTEKKDLPPFRLCQKNSNPPTSCSNFRRGDGGRFSMRTTSAAPFNATKTAPKPPFKTGAALIPAKKTVPIIPPIKDTPEMVAWLRRKEYDPRKSAAESKKIQQLKARLLGLTAVKSQVSSPTEDESIFQQNRSLSFHPGSDSNIQRFKQEQHKSHDDLSHVGEDEEFQPNLEKQVDALTQKCLKSIQLIKLCNQNTLSESVENLLDRVVVPEEDEPQSEPISEQLQRLSSAFDAIQKYFEEQRSSSASPPVFRRLASRDGQNPRKLEIPKTSSGSRHLKLEEDETF